MVHCAARRDALPDKAREADIVAIKCGNERTAADKERARKGDEKSHELLRALCRLPGNGVCADCTATRPGWAVLQHDIHVCIHCAQIHRHIGRHISQVKAINTGTYLWMPDEIAAMALMGNRRPTGAVLHAEQASCHFAPLNAPPGRGRGLRRDVPPPRGPDSGRRSRAPLRAGRPLF